MRFGNSVVILRLLCIPLMLVSIFIVNIFNIPNPMMILVIPVIYFTYSDGYISGLMSGITAIAYAAFFFLVETQDPKGIIKMLTILLNVSVVIILIGKLKARDNRNIRELLRLNDSLIYAATTDKLTGATNRHTFLGTAQEIYANCVRLKKPISALFIDVDHFKEINDVYGHAFGDSVLMRISEIIAHCVRDSDLNCRYGGEEFIALLIYADCSIARNVARRIMDEIRKTQFELYPDFRFSVSIGISCGVPVDTQNLDDLINIADEAMYHAKKNGRDQIVWYNIDEKDKVS